MRPPNPTAVQTHEAVTYLIARHCVLCGIETEIGVQVVINRYRDPVLQPPTVTVSAVRHMIGRLHTAGLVTPPTTRERRSATVHAISGVV